LARISSAAFWFPVATAVLLSSAAMMAMASELLGRLLRMVTTS
jgi:hypothetical protein